MTTMGTSSHSRFACPSKTWVSGSVLTLSLRGLPPCPLPPLHISTLRSSGEEGGEIIMTTMTVREAMTTPTMSDPVLLTHNN